MNETISIEISLLNKYKFCLFQISSRLSCIALSAYVAISVMSRWAEFQISFVVVPVYHLMHPEK